MTSSRATRLHWQIAWRHLRAGDRPPTWVRAVLAMAVYLVVVGLGKVEQRAKRLVRDDVGISLVMQSHRCPEVVGVRVGDHDGVDIFDLETRTAETIDQMAPRVIAGQSRVDHGDATLVLEHVTVHVSEARHADRELRAQDSGRNLGHVGGCVLLLLLRRTQRGRRLWTGWGMIVLVWVLVLHGRAGLRRLRDLVVIGADIVTDPTPLRRTRACGD